MFGYGYTMAHAGYVAVLVDLPGHGGNPAPYEPSSNVAAIDAAYAILEAQPGVDMARVGLIGHSMGAAAVLAAARDRPDRYRATVAVSPGGGEASPATPRNLQLQAGAWEPRFLATAEDLLAQAGGGGSDFENGQARELVTVPGAEHISILFRPASHGAARRWFDAAMEYEAAGVNEYRDWRVLGWLLHVVGWMFIASAVATKYRREPSREKALFRRPLQWVGVVAAPLMASAIVAGLARLVDISSIGGLLVGGALALWFLIAGTFYLVGAYRAGLPDGDDLIRGIGLFAFVWVAVGLSGQLAWNNWLLTDFRLWRWPLFAICCVPWFVAIEIGQGDARPTPRLLWFVLQCASVIGALMLLVRWVAPHSPSIAIVGLIVPLLPAYFALFVFLGSRARRPWACGIAAGLFFGWALAAAFPALGQ